MQPISNAGYDRALTVFSPDGRLFQIEYAREAVKRGTTSIGVKSEEGIIIVVDKKVSSKLIEPSSIEKIFQIDEHIGAASSGLVADARSLIDKSRNEAQVNKIRYNEPISVEGLSKKICDMKQMYTQHGGVRPFGSALIIGGISDNECRLFETDPSGALIEYKATAIGSGRKKAMDIFEKKYEDTLTFKEAIDLALDGLYEATDGKTTEKSVEIAVIEKETGKFRRLSSEEIKPLVEELIERKSEEIEIPEEKSEEDADKESDEE
ncbi:MAG: archaeal proteasome endopeptidase complex subunit alpha [Methanobacteriaceae archaeon]|nr:archaeal proteasome endopeptidase complex subunit alpha [Methanobacteriaceae archaeon]